ncbi:MAG: S-layer protein [Agathobacter sp.]|nr:S-layer protein [Agathobacter sp.]
MRRVAKIWRKVSVLAALVLSMGMVACGNKNDEDSPATNYYYHSLNSEGTTEATELQEVEQELYLIVEINSAKEKMRVFRYANGLEYQVYYGLNTEFCNKYGDYSSVASFGPGDVVTLSTADESGRVKQVTKSDAVWVYDDITRYSVDKSVNKLEIAEGNYRLSDNTYFFSGNKEIKVDEIGEEDVLQVTGIDKEILSVCVMSGHGTLQLSNTELFEGSYLQLNTDIFVQITKDMEMEVPEGKYRLVVANEGWGGSKDITIKRGKTTRVDLDEIKGQGPKSGLIQFVVDVADAKILLDDKLIDYSSPIKIAYGRHNLKVIADGYDQWEKILFVNSEEATVLISLKDDEKQKDSENTKTDNNKKDDSQKEEKSNNSESTQKSTESSEKSSKSDEDDLTDYLATLEELLDSIY